MPGIAECGPCDDIAPAITFGRRERRSGCGPRCSGYDCGHSHVDASAPGLFRGVAAPLLRWLLASSLVAAAAAAAATEPDGDGGGVGPVVLLACAVTGLLLVVILLRTWWIVPQVHADTSGLADAATLARCLAKQDEYAERLGAALRCKTISHDDDDPDHDPAALGAETRTLHRYSKPSPSPNPNPNPDPNPDPNPNPNPNPNPIRRGDAQAARVAAGAVPARARAPEADGGQPALARVPQL